jgi:hypothetical protein
LGFRSTNYHFSSLLPKIKIAASTSAPMAIAPCYSLVLTPATHSRSVRRNMARKFLIKKVKLQPCQNEKRLA